MSPPIHRDALVRLADRLRALHHGARPLLLPNAWDVGSALAVERAGAAAIATTSSGVAGSFGQPDGERIGASEMLLAVLRIAGAVRVPVTADLEAGYGLAADVLVDEMLRAGAVGLNLEDTDRSGSVPVLGDPAAQATRIAAVRRAARAAGVPLVINARIDVFLRGSGELRERVDEAITRAGAYLKAGADCVYPIGLDDPGGIGRLVRRVDGPVNILLHPGSPSLRQLSRLGVRRISVGGGLWDLSLTTVESLARRLLSGDGGPFAQPRGEP
jgi:2-methylisocitrate lyase-like PEP mutase family enzyme